ncbi:hypothetical protein B0J11DRAFT_94311 [Dendryphion nanum]|uniref:Uncharacterized protein n=1 Tax=Dendryphion nanum TaxID=256645 RepID=A0A9P9DF68_9PLEO|nr:hypothetical protein B0J11DRAFT_94311 [Dendryphion nanum]
MTAQGQTGAVRKEGYRDLQALDPEISPPSLFSIDPSLRNLLAMPHAASVVLCVRRGGEGGNQTSKLHWLQSIPCMSACGQESATHFPLSRARKIRFTKIQHDGEMFTWTIYVALIDRVSSRYDDDDGFFFSLFPFPFSRFPLPVRWRGGLALRISGSVLNTVLLRGGGRGGVLRVCSTVSFLVWIRGLWGFWDVLGCGIGDGRG